jgi:hypothetical protein
MLPNQKSTKYLMMKLKKKSKKKINKSNCEGSNWRKKQHNKKKKKSYALRPSWPNKLGLPNKSSGITGLE